MSESFQRKESALAEREKRDKTENSHEGDAASEGLEKFVDSAHEEVDSGATEVIERADEKIDNGPERFGLDKEAGNKIFASGGFAERINSLKSRITSLAANTKTKISSLIDGKSESASEAARPTESAGAALEGEPGAQRPQSLDQYMGLRGRAENFSDRMKEKMQIAQLKLHRVKDPERVLGFAHYLEDNATDKEVEFPRFDANNTEEIQKCAERYKKQGYNVRIEKSLLDEGQVDVWATKDTPFEFKADKYNADSISELIDAPSDPVAVFEQMRELGYHLETYKGDVSSLKSETEPILRTPNMMPFLEKLKTFGGANISRNFFNNGGWKGHDAIRGITQFAKDDAENGLLTADAEKKIEQVSVALGRPVDGAQLERWLRVSEGEHGVDILTAFAEGSKIESDYEIELLLSRIEAVYDADIQDTAAILLKDGFSPEELVNSYGSYISKDKIETLQAAASAFETDPRLLEVVRQADNVFPKFHGGETLSPENIRYFSEVVEKIPDAGAAFATLADLKIQAERYHGEEYLRNIENLEAHKEILDALAKPEFKEFAARCESAGYHFALEDFFSKSDWDRRNLTEIYNDEQFQKILSSENGLTLAKQLGFFETPASQWNPRALESMSKFPHSLEVLQKIQELYGYRYNPKDDYSYYNFQDLRRVMEDKELRDKLLDPKTVDTFDLAKKEFGAEFSIRGAVEMAGITGDPKIQAALQDLETISFVKGTLKKSNKDLKTVAALATCDPTLREAIRKLADEFEYVPEGRYDTHSGYNPQTDKVEWRKELTINGVNRLEQLRDNPQIFEIQAKLEAVGMRRNPLNDMESLEKVLKNDLFPIFEQTKNSSKIQEFLWRNLDAAASLAEMSPEKIPVYVEIFQKIDDSPSQEIQRLKDQLLSQLLKSERPVEDYQKIESIFIKNNIPTVGKVFNVFELLYDKERLDGMLNGSAKASPVLEQASSRRRYYTIYQDLLNIHIESGNRALKEYIEVLKGGSDVLDKYERSGIESLAPREQEQLRYFVGKLETLLAKSTLDTSEEAFQLAEASDLGGRVGHVREGLKVAEGQTVLERVSEMYLRPTGLDSLDQVLEKMREAKTSADERSRAMIAEAMTKAADGKAALAIQEGDLLKGVDSQYIANIFQNGSVAKEFLGASSDSDATPLDTDLSIVLASDLERGNESAIDNSIANGYGSLLFVVKDHGRFQRTEQGMDAKPETDKRELFKTGALGERHYGIRTGFATTEIDFMIAKEDLASKPQEMEKVFFEIAQNGFYIPIVDKNGGVIFTPEMYDERRKAFQGLEKFDGEALSFKPTAPGEPSYAAVSEIAAALPEDSERVNEASQMIRGEMQKALEGLGVSLRPEFDTSILGAELLDTGSTGRHTNTPGDFDFDFSLKLDAADFAKAPQLAEAIKGLMTMEKDDSHEDAGGYYQLRAKGVTEIGGVKLEKPLDIDIGFAKKSDLSVYGSHDAIRDKLDFIEDHDGDEAYKQVVANIVLTKQILKEGHAYKKVEHGGIGGIGVENWILANGGNLEAAFKNFRNAAYENGARLPLQEFKQRYKILDAGVNIKYLGHDNFVDILKPEGYEAMLNAIDAYLVEQKQ